MKNIVLTVILLTLTLTASAASVSYICSVPNCQTCSYLGVCGLCNNNYMLAMNMTSGQTYCAPVLCQMPNCQTCLANNVCSVCASGYYVNMNGSCTMGTAPTNCPDDCAYCNSAGTCLLCEFGSTLQNGQCFPTGGILVSNCISYFAGLVCQYCENGMIVDPAFACYTPASFAC